MIQKLDTEILKKREEQKKEQQQTLEDGVFLDGRILKFERKEILDTWTMFVPDIMNSMPEWYAKVQYPSEFRPKKILTTTDFSVSMGFTVFSQQIQSEDRTELLQHLKTVIKRANSDIQISSCMTLKKVLGSYFSFRSHTMDRDLFNLMLLAEVGEQMVHGSFHCIYQEHLKWERIVLMMWETIQMLDKEK